MEYEDNICHASDKVYTNYEQAEAELINGGFTRIKETEYGLKEYYPDEGHTIHEHAYILKVNLIKEND